MRDAGELFGARLRLLRLLGAAGRDFLGRDGLLAQAPRDGRGLHRADALGLTALGARERGRALLLGLRSQRRFGGGLLFRGRRARAFARGERLRRLELRAERLQALLARGELLLELALREAQVARLHLRALELDAALLQLIAQAVRFGAGARGAIALGFQILGGGTTAAEERQRGERRA